MRLKHWLIIGGIIAITAAGLWILQKTMITRQPVAAPLLLAEDPQLARTVHKTSSWFSSLYEFPSSPVYMQPGVFRFTPEGVEVGVPGITTVPERVQASFQSWCTLEWPKKIDQTHVIQYGDFDVRVALSSETGESTAHLVQGSPITTITNAPHELSLRCPGMNLEIIPEGILLSRPETATKLLLQAEKPEVFNSQGTIRSSEGKYRFVFIPEKVDPSLLGKTPWDVPFGTQVDWQFDPQSNNWLTTYHQLVNQPQEQWTLLYPHHQASLDQAMEVIGTYQTVLGPLQLIKGSSFSTRRPQADLPNTFPAVQNVEQRAAIQQAIIADSQKYLTEEPPAGVYFRGTWIGALNTLTQLAELYGPEDIFAQLQTKLQTTMELSSKQFTYDEDRKLYRALNPEFGNEFGNDHHFHYGYYLRAAAYLAEKGRLSEDVRLMADDMALDIATTDRNSARYPFLRTYSVYEGHSWADARAAFADGNNQESTSEALNAWYGLALWGRSTQNTTFETTGSWLFGQELSGVESYWFGVNNPFPAGYSKPLASLVWAGKREFNTWFSAQPGHIIGIQYLPITPASIYLKPIMSATDLPNRTTQLDPNLADHEWFDLHLAVQSYSQPEQARKQLQPGIDPAGLKLRSLLLQTIYAQSEVEKP